MRVTKLCEKFGLKPGRAMDLAAGWDLDREEDRKRKTIDEEKPFLLIGSPPCTFFSNMQELNKAKFKNEKT